MSPALRMSTESAPVLLEPSSQAELLGALAKLAQELEPLQTTPYDDTASISLTVALTRIVQSALATVTALERLDAAGRSATVSEPDWETEIGLGVRTSAAAPARLGDVCFACTFELNVALRALKDARDDGARLSAAETARRKLYRAIHAVARVASGPELLPVCESLCRRCDVELESSLAVRRLYAEFRHNLRRAESDSGEAVLTALRYAAGALATLTASPHYRAVRVSDAALLRRQHERLLEWARSGKPRDSGLQLLDDISTTASLLGDINRRQELRRHDTELLNTLLADPSPARDTWLAHLDRLAGLDDALDRLTAQLRLSPGPGVIGAIMARLSVLV